MSYKVKKIQYFSTNIEKKNGSETEILSIFSKAGINYQAFISIVQNTKNIQFTLFPDDSEKLKKTAKQNGFNIKGPYSALHIEGDDEAGACADVFKRLSDAQININMAFGIANIKNGYGIIVYLDDNDCEKSISALTRISHEE